MEAVAAFQPQERGYGNGRRHREWPTQRPPERRDAGAGDQRHLQQNGWSVGPLGHEYDAGTATQQQQ